MQLNTFTNKAIITIPNDKIYLGLVMLLVPLMNFLSGISIDLYAPSLPAIALNFHTTVAAAKNTITFTMIGFALGCLLFGILYDTLGRKKIIIPALIVFSISSLIAPHCHSIAQLMLIRFIQGLTTAAISIGSRTLIADHFTGERFVVGMLYTSFAYGLGPVIGPFIGGYLQYHFNWQANFYAFAFCGFSILILFIAFVQERFVKTSEHTISNSFKFYKALITNSIFLFSALIFGSVQLQLMLYPTIGPFLVEHSLKYSALVYGNTALIVGLGYLLGTLSNRFLLRSFSQPKLITIGFIISGLACVIQLVFSFTKDINIFSLVFPITLMGYAVAFIYINILSNCLKLFSKNMGISSSAIAFSLMFFAACGVFGISYLKINSLYDLFIICLSIFLFQLLFYECYLKKQLFSQHQ